MRLQKTTELISSDLQSTTQRLDSLEFFTGLKVIYLGGTIVEDKQHTPILSIPMKSRRTTRWDMFATWVGANANNGTWFVGGVLAAWICCGNEGAGPFIGLIICIPESNWLYWL